MTSTAAMFYPSQASTPAVATPASVATGAPAAPPQAPAAPTTARSTADVLYGAPAAPTAAPAAAPAPAAPPPAERPVAGTPPAETSPAAAIYADHLDFKGYVNLQEPAAKPEDFRLDVPRSMYVDTPEARAADATAQQAMAGVGLGATMAAELFGDVVAAARAPAPISTTSEQCADALRQAWGAGYDARLAQARAAFKDYAARDPNGAAVIERTGLGNDPVFIRKIVAMSARVAARGR